MFAIKELVGEILVSQHRTRNELRKQCLEGCEIEKTARRRRVFAVDVDEIGNRLENVEGYADGQDDLAHQWREWFAAVKNGRQAVNEEVEVFKISQDEKRADNCYAQQYFSPASIGLGKDKITKNKAPDSDNEK